MGSKICMNKLCRATSSPQWKKGWGLKSGRFATLCYTCGYAYETLVFCETFHMEESGWRECRVCEKRIHCGCIASKYLHEYMEFGGVACISCAKQSESQSLGSNQIKGDKVPNGFSTLKISDSCDPRCFLLENRENGGPTENGRVQLRKSMEANEPVNLFQPKRSDTNSSTRQHKEEEIAPFIGEISGNFTNLLKQPVGPSMFPEPDNSRFKQGIKMFEPFTHPSLSFSLNTLVDNTNSTFPCSGANIEGKECIKVPSFQEVQRSRHTVPKLAKIGQGIISEVNKGTAYEARIARPPVEGRGRPQLLPRYWPRITDQELQKLSGDLNSTIVPLFEKVLSASDAGRIGRLVLPKACAEAYFPPISQSEGVPIMIRDVKGKEWTFQFRFWPNNNSRMYVLEGVTPCIQNMQLQAGDTVMFSRIDPGGKLVMGFRKSTNNADLQGVQTSALPNGSFTSETSDAGLHDDLITHGYIMKGDSQQQFAPISEKKKTRTIGSKKKKLRMHSDDPVQIDITWAEAQELFCPPPTVKPTIVLIENYEFEEYDEPPVFGKRNTLSPQLSGCSCSSPEDMTPRELDCILRVDKDFKKHKVSENSRLSQEPEPSGLDALANAAVLGEHVGDSGESSVGATTKHPRHRPGCSCIVCIQPPSGKGKHKPTCVCNVCLTVKRRFRTLMLRKKKRQSEREAELDLGKGKLPAKDEGETDTTYGQALPLMDQLASDRNQREIPKEEVTGSSNGQLDLNCDPDREDDMLAEASKMSISSLLRAASLPWEMFTRRNGLGYMCSKYNQTMCNGEGET